MRYQILHDFKGSQTGSTTEDFKAGTEAELTDYLASCVDPAWIRRVDAAGSGHDAAAAPEAVAVARRKKTASTS